jgi:hypothetical protein
MRVCVIASGAGDLPDAATEIQEVANTLGAAGHAVHLAAATRAGLRTALAASPFDLVWFAGHASAAGLALDDGVWSAVECGRWLAAVRAWSLVLNACFSAEHVVVIQQIADVDVVATIAPAGVEDAAAGDSALFLARALVESDNLAEATRRASANGQLQYRFFPCGDAMAQSTRPDQAHEDVAALVRAIKGDPFTGTPGLIATVASLVGSVGALTQSIESHRSATDARLRALEDYHERRVALSPRAMVLAALMFALIFVLIIRLGGG